MKHYRSSIPKAARERVTATFVTGPQKYKAEYVLKRKIVGIRYFHNTGELAHEEPLKDGLVHGVAYWSNTPGKLVSAEPYYKGKEHGTARQWSEQGELIGSYTMRHGTGLDLWWGRCGHGSYRLSEARYMLDGRFHGFEWWWRCAGHRLWQERHFWNHKMHGIEREWNERGRLSRGYPKYWVNGDAVAKRQYIRACVKDPVLPPFRERDNRPRREFPPEVAAALKRRAGGQRTV